MVADLNLEQVGRTDDSRPAARFVLAGIAELRTGSHIRRLRVPNLPYWQAPLGFLFHIAFCSGVIEVQTEPFEMSLE